MSIDLARLCEAMRDRMYAERGGDLSPPALLESLLDAAATELRRQREEGAAVVPASLRGSVNPFPQPSPAPSPPPAEERESIAKEVRAAWWVNCPGISTWSDLGPGHRDVYLRIADYVLQREENLRKQVQHWTDDAARYASNADHWQRRFDKVEAERDTLRAEVERLKSSERERLIAEMVSELHHAGPYTALGRFIVHERARLKAQEPKP